MKSVMSTMGNAAALLCVLCLRSNLASAAATPLSAPSLAGTQIVCPATSCGKLSNCGRTGLASCGTRALILRNLDLSEHAYTTAAQVLPSIPKANVLRARQYSAVDRAAGRYFIMVQPVAESTSNVTCVGAPRLFIASRANASAAAAATATVQELELRMLAPGGAAVPPMESLELVPAGAGGNGAGALLAVGRHGELYSIDVGAASPTAGLVTVVSAAMWPAPALLTQGLTALDHTTGTLYALAQMPQYVGTNDPVCGNTHGARSCPVSVMAFDTRGGHGGIVTAAPAAKNVSTLLYCFDGSNAQLGCSGTNIQHMWFDSRTRSLAAVTRTTKDGPAVSSIDTTSGKVTTVYKNPAGEVYEFISSRGYDDGADAPNPSAFDHTNGTVYVQLRTGVERFVVGISFPHGAVTARFDLPNGAEGKASEEPFAHMQVF